MPCFRLQDAVVMVVEDRCTIPACLTPDCILLPTLVVCVSDLVVPCTGRKEDTTTIVTCHLCHAMEEDLCLHACFPKFTCRGRKGGEHILHAIVCVSFCLNYPWSGGGDRNFLPPCLLPGKLILLLLHLDLYGRRGRNAHTCKFSACLPCAWKAMDSQFLYLPGILGEERKEE